jgi:hypothetical protein
MSIVQPGIGPEAQAPAASRHGDPAVGASAADLASQPAVGVIGALVAVIICLLLGVAIPPLDSLQILGSVTTFSLPLLIASALWWHGGPIHTHSRLLGGIANTALIVGGAVVLTALAQLIVGRGDLSHLLSTTPAVPGHSRPAFPSYPWTLPLAGLIFLAMIIQTFVWDRYPLHRLPPLASGIAAIVISWGVGLLGYELLANWNPVIPQPVQSALGLSNPGGPTSAFNLLGWTLSVAVWAVVLFIPLKGRPFARIASEGIRAVTATAAVLALGWGTFLLLKGPIGLTVPEIAAACGSLIAAAIMAALIFEGWPSRLVAAGSARDASLLATVAVLAAIMFAGLKAIGDGATTWPPSNPVYLWMTVCTLNFLAAGSILWFGIWRRWPVATPAQPAPRGADANLTDVAGEGH